jgi:hypothetical protein
MKPNNYAHTIVPILVSQGLVLEEESQEYMDYLGRDIHSDAFNEYS